MTIEKATARRAQMMAMAVGAALLVLAAPASAQERGDFNGDGVGDLAIGAPDEGVIASRAVGGVPTPVNLAAAGTVTIVYGTPANGLSTAASAPPPLLLHQDVAGVLDLVEAGDRFGAALAAGDFNGDGYSDLVVSVPGDNAFQLFEGGPGGIDPADDRMTLGTSFVDNQGLPLTLTAGFAVGDFNGDALDDLAIEATEREGIGIRGNVVVMYSSTTFGPQFVGLDIFAFDNAAVAGELPDTSVLMVLASGDFSGDGADDLAVGLPFADVVTSTGAPVMDGGTVTIIPGAAGSVTDGGLDPLLATGLTQLDANSLPRTSEHFGESLAAGDFDGDGADDLAVGTPDEDVVAAGGSIVTDGGFVAVFTRAARLHGIYTQLPLGQNPQRFDAFGAALAAADFNGDGAEDLAIGTPGDAVGGVSGAGTVTVLHGIRGTGLPRPASAGLPQINGIAQTFHQASTGVGDNTETGDHFGATLSAANVGRSSHADLIVGVPNEDVLVSLGGDLGGIQMENRADAGVLHALYGSAAGLQGSGSQLWSQNSGGVPDGVETGDRFGSALP